MCGIAGFIGFDNNTELAKDANYLQKHRGPDHQGIWFDEYISLSHQRLSIIDLSERSNQPLEKDGLVIVFNGEIYNYQELKKQLLENNSGINFTTTSDTEVVLEYYRHFGVDALKYFRGMFAFAIYDKHSKKLFAARDHFGIKPFFYTQIGNSFAFASELKTLTIVPGFDKSINRDGLVNAINYLWLPSKMTIFNSCFKLKPGHYLLYEGNGTYEIHKYFDLDNRNNITSEESKIIKSLDLCLKDSISQHLIADVPVSTFLSGGLDSSLISVLAKEHSKSLSTYTIGTNSNDKKIEKMTADEKYAKKLAENFNLDYNEIIIEPNILELLPKIVYHLDEPIGDPAAINTFLICEAARKKGVKVLLSGMGADEIFLGYRRQKALLFALKYRRLPNHLKKIIKLFINLLPVKFLGRGLRFARWSKKFISFAELPLSEAYRMSYSYYSKDELLELFDAKYKNEIEALSDFHKELFENKELEDIENKMCFTDINMFMEGLNLTYTDRASMACSVEVRVPFIDKEVVCYAMNIPGNLKVKNNESKYILKKVSEKYLPKDVIYRPKASFGAPIRSWISGELKSMVDDLLSFENIKKRGIFNPIFVQDLIQKDRYGLEDNAYRIYQLLTMELWFRQFVDQN